MPARAAPAAPTVTMPPCPAARIGGTAARHMLSAVNRSAWNSRPSVAQFYAMLGMDAPRIEPVDRPHRRRLGPFHGAEPPAPLHQHPDDRGAEVAAGAGDDHHIVRSHRICSRVVDNRLPRRPASEGRVSTRTASGHGGSYGAFRENHDPVIVDELDRLCSCDRDFDVIEGRRRGRPDDPLARPDEPASAHGPRSRRRGGRPPRAKSLIGRARRRHTRHRYRK